MDEENEISESTIDDNLIDDRSMRFIIEIDYNQELRDYARSKEALQLKIKDDFNNELMNLKTEKTSLIQELNKRLVELDKINEEKRDLSSKLIQ